MQNKKIVFKLKHLYENDPVDRLRGSMIVEALQKKGYDVALYNNQKKIDVIVYLGDDLYDKIIYKHINAAIVVQDLQDDPFKGVASSYMKQTSKSSLWQKIMQRFENDGFQYGLYQLILKYFWRLNYKEYIKNVDYILTSSYSLAKSVKRFNSRVVTIPDAINTDVVPKNNYESQKVKICWIGTVNNIGYLLLVNEVLEELQKKYAIEVVLITSKEIYNDDKLNAVLKQYRFEYSFVQWSLESVDEEIKKCDIAIAPLPEGVAKSTNKILAYMGLGIACVCSGSEDYEILSNEADESLIYLKDNEMQSWMEALEGVIVSQEKRETLGKNGYRLSQNYTLEKIVQKYEEFFQTL